MRMMYRNKLLNRPSINRQTQTKEPDTSVKIHHGPEEASVKESTEPGVDNAIPGCCVALP